MADSNPSHGYHIADIPRGKFGETSKILEEVQELIDAERQGVRIMMLCELSDLVGAIEGYLNKYFPNMSMHDLQDMKQVTKRAFQSGSRK